ncbi:MAG: hypothetical protein GY820_19830 [Gammaproteobacteria bacterium]|nr:hypothetical protein [Gammaproteobacteria bacterium]
MTEGFVDQYPETYQALLLRLGLKTPGYSTAPLQGASEIFNPYLGLKPQAVRLRPFRAPGPGTNCPRRTRLTRFAAPEALPPAADDNGPNPTQSRGTC